MLYISIFVLLLILTYRYDYKNYTKKKMFWYGIILLILIFVSGLRYRLGVDSIRYEESYKYLPSLFELGAFNFDSTRYAPGYIVFTAIAKTISDEFVALQLLQSALINITFFWFVNKYSSRIFFSITLYFILLYFNYTCEVLREACAVAFFLMAFPYFIKNKWIQYYIFASISFSFHPSAFVCFIIPLIKLPVIKNVFLIGKKTFVLLIGILISGYIINKALFSYIQLIEIASIQESAASYEGNDLSGSVLNIGGIITVFFRYLLYPIVSVLAVKAKLKSQRKTSIVQGNIELMVTLSLIVSVLYIPIALFYRYNNYFLPFAIIAISNFAFHPIVIKKHYKKLSFAAWCLFFSPLLIYTMYGLNATIPNTNNLKEGMRYYPYSSVFSKQKDHNRENLFNFHNAF